MSDRKDAHMKHGLVSISGYDYFSQYALSFCDLVDEADTCNDSTI